MREPYAFTAHSPNDEPMSAWLAHAVGMAAFVKGDETSVNAYDAACERNSTTLPLCIKKESATALPSIQQAKNPGKKPSNFKKAYLHIFAAKQVLAAPVDHVSFPPL